MLQPAATTARFAEGRPLLKFFLVGCPRSGTTAIQQALNRHSRIAIPPETEFFSLIMGYLRHSRWAQRRHLKHIAADLQIDLPMPSRRLRRPDEAAAVFDDIARRYVQRLGRNDVTHFGDKTPHHLPHLPRILAAYPHAKIILACRDGRDIALSLSKVPWGPPSVYAAFSIWLKMCRWHRWALQQKGLDLLCVRYEDLALDPRKELRRITDFLGLEYEIPMAEGEGNREGVPEWEYAWKAKAFEKIDASRVDVWKRELSTDQVRDLERWGRWAFHMLGYELVTDTRGHSPLIVAAQAYGRIFTWRARQSWNLLKRLRKAR
jgi:hypothetical protein